MNDPLFLPLSVEFKVIRDQLRIAGYELVRYTQEHARKKAAPIRHPVTDYEYGIHKIQTIEAGTGQIYISRDPWYSSATALPGWVKYHIDQERPEGVGLLKRWFKDPANVILTAIVPPFGLTLLGMAAVGERLSKRQQDERRRVLQRLSEFPKFAPRDGA